MLLDAAGEAAFRSDPDHFDFATANWDSNPKKRQGQWRYRGGQQCLNFHEIATDVEAARHEEAATVRTALGQLLADAQPPFCGVLGVSSAGRASAQNAAEWTEPFPPFRIAGNLYYVGSKGLASYLVTTPQGHILINSNLVESVPQIRASVEQLGFRFADIRVLLISHAHWDHIGGNALFDDILIHPAEADDQRFEHGPVQRSAQPHRRVASAVRSVIVSNTGRLLALARPGARPFIRGIRSIR